MFGQSVQAWQPFYGTIATSSAGLVGLLFVALTLNAAILNRGESTGLRELATQTFTTFVLIIGFSLMFLIPEISPLGLGLPLLCIAVLGLIGSLRVATPLFRTKNSWRILYMHFGLRILGLIWMIFLAGRIIVTGETGNLYWLVGPMMILLMSATLHVWSLLVSIQQSVTQK